MRCPPPVALAHTPAARPRALVALLFLGTLLAAAPASAQVMRCTDARTGKVTYTDAACDSGAQSREVQPRQSPEELARERAQSQEAAQRMRERLAAEQAAAQEREALEAARQEREARRAPSTTDYAASPACASARRALEAVAGRSSATLEDSARLDAAQRQMELSCLGPEGYARAEAARAQRPQVVVVPQPVWPARPRPPHRPDRQERPYIKECTSFTCTDSNGKRYPRTGRGSFEER